MKTYLALFMISMWSSFVLTPIVRRISMRYGWIDASQDRGWLDNKAVPRLGGVAIFGAVLISLAALLFVNNLVAQSMRAARPQLFALLVPATLMFLFGLYKDLRRADTRFQIIAPALAGALFYAMGGRIGALSIPFLGSVELPLVLGFAFTMLWIIGITNAFSLIDGRGGLTAGLCLFVSLVILVVSLILSNSFPTVITLTLSGALIVFLRYNFNPSPIFLGDSGSLFVGFVLAALSVQGFQKASTTIAVAIPLMAFGSPVIDTGFTIVRRFISGRLLFQNDRVHAASTLTRGWSHSPVTFVVYAASALFGMLALLFFSDRGGSTTGLMLFVVGTTIVLAVGRLRYREMGGREAGLKRDLADRRLNAANNIRIRRAGHAISNAITLSELFKAAREMLEVGEFVYASVQLVYSGDVLRNERVLALDKGAEVKDGFICWSWKRAEIEKAEIVGSDRFWMLSLPLSTEGAAWGYLNLYREFGSEAPLVDINYLSGLFRREMAQAAKRILIAGEQEILV